MARRRSHTGQGHRETQESEAQMMGGFSGNAAQKCVKQELVHGGACSEAPVYYDAFARRQVLLDVAQK